MQRAVQAVFALVLGLGISSPAHAQDASQGQAEKPINWVRGPSNVDVGERIGELKLGEKLVFANKQDTERILKSMGNPTHGSEVGIVTSSVDGENWFVLFEWRPVGFVKDDERNEIDADALLASIQKGTEAANEERKKQGAPGLHVTGWELPPRYDAATHNLTWAIRGRSDDGVEVVNYNVRVLGREGVMSMTLVDDPAAIAVAKSKIDGVIQNFSFKRGKTYAEWVPGDKVAAYGLTALVAAGAGAAAVKTGLFATLGAMLMKGGKAVLVALAALAAGVIGSIKKLFTKKNPPPPPPPSPPTNDETTAA